MTRPRLEVAEVIRSCRDAFLEQYGAGLTPEQRRALDDLTACRTAALRSTRSPFDGLEVPAGGPAQP